MQDPPRPRIMGVVGWSGSGKTTLIVRLLPELARRGLRVSTIKHAHHRFDVDQPGKDSYEHRRAGAVEVMVSSSERWALMREHRGAGEPGLDELLAHMRADVDLILVEGFKTHAHPKVEVWRPVGDGQALAPGLWRGDADVLAVASDDTLPAAERAAIDRPVLALDDIPAIAGFMIEQAR